jgi:hypothetical protein
VTAIDAFATVVQLEALLRAMDATLYVMRLGGTWRCCVIPVDDSAEVFAEGRDLLGAIGEAVRQIMAREERKVAVP